MSDSTAKLDQIRSILNTEWNPLKTSDPDAYATFARQAQRMLEEHRAEKDIAAYLHEVASELTGTPETAYSVSQTAAAKLKALA